LIVLVAAFVATAAGCAREKEQTLNRLQHEKSPYLLQHADNPVDWYPWGEEAFQAAKEQDKPIFLSIGYATCHWCHVMEHESFEDPQVARLMNQTFINIKVDREERPDIDGLYMTTALLLTGRGGWPLTIIMGPDQRPFFAATYIPKDSSYGRPGMLELIPKIAEAWNTRREDVESSSESILKALRSASETRADGPPLEESILRQAYEELSQQFDEENGGFGSAPKFPSAHNLLFLLRYWRRSGEQRAVQMVEKTLAEMRRGGVFDHVGYGFHRYATDERWRVPHFEKMLYDQAMLALAYTETYQATKEQFYADTAGEILTYVLGICAPRREGSPLRRMRTARERRASSTPGATRNSPRFSVRRSCPSWSGCTTFKREATTGKRPRASRPERTSCSCAPTSPAPRSCPKACAPSSWSSGQSGFGP